ncbi:MAG: hypothetical protein K2H37_12130, partial [Lachnospiraceae bacterium]|nr:hypothetical protein [Lachnospiraceae bacterium]
MGDNRLQVNGNSDRRERKRFFKAGYLLPFILGVCIGGALLWGISVRRDHTDTAAPESIESMEQESADISEPAYAETVVNYPFFSGEEGWSLV